MNDTITRRMFLGTAMGAAVATGLIGAGALSGCKGDAMKASSLNSESGLNMSTRPRMPVGFVAHGAPTLAVDARKGADLQRWAAEMPRPGAILVISAHWENAPVTIGTTRTRELMYDFYGFPRELYEIRYDAPGAPELAARIESMLAATPSVGPIAREDRPLDHGVWVPLLHMAPDASVPVLQLSMPSRLGPTALFELGRALAPLRDEGVLILGSGNLVHNLRQLDWRGNTTPSWAEEFDQWSRDIVAAGDLDSLVDYRNKAPGLRIAHPTEEHFQPVLVAAGAASIDGAPASFPVEGFEFGSISRRCVQFG